MSGSASRKYPPELRERAVRAVAEIRTEHESEWAADLVARQLPTASDRLWVAGITYVSTWSGRVYTAFVIDAYVRRILDWRCGTTMSTQLVLDALNQAIRPPPGPVRAWNPLWHEVIATRSKRRCGTGNA